MTTNFTTKKSKLLGEDTQASILSGDVDGVNPVNQFNFVTVDGGGGGADTNFAEVIYASLSLTATESINKAYIQHIQPADRNNDGGTIRIREDDINGTVIASGGYSAGNGGVTLALSAIITNQPIGSRTYVFTRIQFGSPGDFIRLHAGATSIAYIVDITDTHVATLSGANTQRTVGEDILS